MNLATPSLTLNGPFAPRGAPPLLVRERLLRVDRTTVLYPPDETPMRLLSPAERASLRDYWDPAAPWPEGRTFPVQAAIFIRFWAQLHRSSTEILGTRMLSALQRRCAPRRGATKYPWYGFELVRLVDDTAFQHGVRVYIGDQRLTDRLRELGWEG